MKRLPYTPCKLYYDGCRDLKCGDYLKTPAGSAYLVQSMRQNGRRPYRKHLECLRWPVAQIPADARVHPLYWYSRNRLSSKAGAPGLPGIKGPARGFADSRPRAIGAWPDELQREGAHRCLGTGQ